MSVMEYDWVPALSGVGCGGLVGLAWLICGTDRLFGLWFAALLLTMFSAQYVVWRSRNRQ